MSMHIAAQPGEIAERVLMPGDPLRAKHIAEHFLDGAKEYSHIRNMLGYTGTYKGVPVSIQGSGMGMPSMAIYANELIAEYGVKRILRIGTCGALQKKIAVRDLILPKPVPRTPTCPTIPSVTASISPPRRISAFWKKASPPLAN